jgi:5'-nucleotidase
MFAPGIKALVNVMKKIGEVFVVAPNSPQSGQGHAITINEPLRLNKVNVFDGVEAYECSGTPADCVKLATNVLLKDRKIDICVSGINHGSNASINILYSGTMSAAMEASLEGILSIGFSLLDYSFEADFTPFEEYIELIVRNTLEKGLGACRLLNVNFPKIPKSEIRGIKICRQAEANWVEEFQEAKDPRGEKYYWLTGKFVQQDNGTDTDLWALENHYISIVPSGHDLTKYEALDQLKYVESLRT